MGFWGFGAFLSTIVIQHFLAYLKVLKELNRLIITVNSFNDQFPVRFFFGGITSEKLFIRFRSLFLVLIQDILSALDQLIY